MDPKLTPLSLDATGKIQPTNGSGAPSGPPVTSVPSRVDDNALANAADAWVDEHPTNDFDPAAEPVAVVPPIPLDTTEEPVAETPPATEEPAVETPTTEAPATEPTTPPGTEPISEKPATEAPVGEKPAEAAAAPAKPTYAPEEKFALGEGAEWTRGEIIAALRERVELQPKAADADGFREIFHVDAARAKETWGPIVQRLAAEPNTTKFLDDYLSNPTKAAYLEACAAHFDSTVPPEPGAPAPGPGPASAIVERPANDPIVRERDELRAYRQKQVEREGAEAFNRDLATATAKYPFLATDTKAMQGLILTSQALYNQEMAAAAAEKREPQAKPFLLNALEINASIYDAMLIARNAHDNVEPAPAVPATLGSPGAAPAATRTRRPAVFKGDLNDAVDDWEANKPPEFR